LQDMVEVVTVEKGRVGIKRSLWTVVPNRFGRNYKVVVVAVDASMGLEIETEAFTNAITEASDGGPLFILLEIDTPGGRISLCRQICSAITQRANCPVVGYVRGGEHGGALSAGAAIALACDKLYMAPNTVIGAATAVAETSGSAVELKDVYGETVGDKISSAWEAQFAALAERNNRPAVVAKAMVDKEMEVVEVAAEGGRVFVEAASRRPEQRIVRTWSRKGSVLTLTAGEAVDCGIADKIVENRRDVLAELNAAGAAVVTNTAPQEARTELGRAKKKLERLKNSIDARAKQSYVAEPAPRALRNLREAIADYKEIIALGRRYKDLNINVASFEKALNSAEAAYDQVRLDIINSRDEKER
jgi:membrane-bound ClpP family serine protease